MASGSYPLYASSAAGAPCMKWRVQIRRCCAGVTQEISLVVQASELARAKFRVSVRRGSEHALKF